MGCTTKANWKCNMCWDYCDSLVVYEKTKDQMCNDDICMEGCKLACGYTNSKRTQTKHKQTVNFRNVQILRNKLSWQYHSNIAKKLVFIVNGLRNRMDKIEIQQTASTAINISNIFKYHQIGIMAISDEGFVGQVDFEIKLRYFLSRNKISNKPKRKLILRLQNNDKIYKFVNKIV